MSKKNRQKAARRKAEQEQEQKHQRRDAIIAGVLAILCGLFLLIDPWLTRTSPYEELVDATIEIKQVGTFKHEGSWVCGIEDTNGEWYMTVGHTEWRTDLTEVLKPGDRVNIKYQPAYYRFDNLIQELWLGEQRLSSYQNWDGFEDVFLTIVGVGAVGFGIVLLVLYGKKKKK